MNLADRLSRIPLTKSNSKFADLRSINFWMQKKGSPFKVTGRLVLNIWRLLRADITVTDHSIEAMSLRLLSHKFPFYRPEILTTWYTNPGTRSYVIDHVLKRTNLTLELLGATDILERSSEFARLYGIELESVLTRGSQYRVEASMVRLSRQKGMVLRSPSYEDVAKQCAAECLPLVMEPESAFYPDPVLVLDFQSLYPSIMIAYNMWYAFLSATVSLTGINSLFSNFSYSTCLGKIGTSGDPVTKLGVSSFDARNSRGLHNRDIFISANGILFAKRNIRKSTLAQMLEDILETRVMVKDSMKLYAGNGPLLKVLDSRQLALKLLANVTYGYTAASFSGRMPCVELGDAVVQTGRETLEGAIRMINENSRWGARVVYGDTDSVFVLLKGATKSRAFEIGKEIAQAVTDANPSPIKLRFEKVYLPCILSTKKRYVGYKYESRDQKCPEWDAKGIETVRRDGCEATSKLLRTSLEILFEKRDLSLVKAYLVNQFTKILQNRVSLKDFIISKAVKLGTYRYEVYAMRNGFPY
jgi:DNA polymerase zeta